MPSAISETQVVRYPTTVREGPGAGSKWTWVVLSLPFLFYALLLPQFGSLPRNDYWDDFRDVLTPEGALTNDVGAWLDARSNEHRIGLLLPIWLGNWALADGDNRGLSAISLLILIATFVVLLRKLPNPIRAAPSQRVLWGLPIAIALVSPAAAHNWVLGFSGNQWFLANLLAVLSLAAITSSAPWGVARIAMVAVPVLLAAFTHSTYVSLALTIVVASLLLRLARRIRVALWTLAGIALLSFWVGYARPRQHAAPERDPAEIGIFATTYLGGFFTENPSAAFAIGLLGVTGLAYGWWSLRRFRSDDTLRFWPLVAIYGASAAILTAVGRGADPSTSAAATSRYASLQALFWIGTAVLLLYGLRASKARRVTMPLAAVIVVLLALNLQLGMNRLRSQLEGVRWQPVAALAFRWGVQDPDVQAHATPFAPPRGIRFFKRIGHVPFDRPAEGSDLEIRLDSVPQIEAGSWTSSTELPGRHVRLSGRLPEGAGPRDVVALVLADGSIVGAGVPIQEPAKSWLVVFGSSSPLRHWIGYAPRRNLRAIVPVYSRAGEAEVARLRVDTSAREPLRRSVRRSGELGEPREIPGSKDTARAMGSSLPSRE